MNLLVSNIQRFSLHDGPGIRTTIFLVGCGLHCPWCANPENIHKYENIAELTKGELSYKEVSTDELYKIILKDIHYYGNCGGVTFSGGEPLLYADGLEELLIKLREVNINCCVETSLYVSEQQVTKMIPYIDEWIVDLKCADSELYRRMLGGEFYIFKNNIDVLTANIDRQKLTVRVPLMREFNIDEKQLVLIKKMCCKIMPGKIQFLQAHGLAKHKYELLGLPFVNYTIMDDAEKNSIIELIKINFKDYSGEWEIC